MKNIYWGLMILWVISCKPANLKSNSAPTVSQDPIVTPSPTKAPTAKIKVVGMTSAWWKNCMSLVLNGDESNRIEIGCNTQQDKIGTELEFKGYNPNVCNRVRIILNVDSSKGDCGGTGCKDADKRIEAGKPIWERSTAFTTDKMFFKVFSAKDPKWDNDKEFVILDEFRSFFEDAKEEAKNMDSNEYFFIIGAEDQPRTVIQSWSALNAEARTLEEAKIRGLDWNDFVIGIRGRGLAIENYSGGCATK